MKTQLNYMKCFVRLLQEKKTITSLIPKCIHLTVNKDYLFSEATLSQKARYFILPTKSRLIEFIEVSCRFFSK